MDELARSWMRMRFRLFWFTSKGKEFQNLFADLMHRAYPQDFQKVKPSGPEGDMKCDGYWKSRRCVFQCYAPDSLRRSPVTKKIQEDFKGALSHWKDMSEWAFVHNDPDGLPPKAVQLLDGFRKEHPEISILEWAWPQALEQFEHLSDNDLIDMFGHPPPRDTFQQIEFQDLKPVLHEIAKGEPDISPPLSPPSVEKLEKNELGQDEIRILHLGRSRVSLVEEYFTQHPDPAFADKIAAAFQTRYNDLRAKGRDSSATLLQLQKFAGWGQGTSSRHDVAVIAVIVYFFDRCDIFEDPDEPNEQESKATGISQ